MQEVVPPWRPASSGVNSCASGADGLPDRVSRALGGQSHAKIHPPCRHVDSNISIDVSDISERIGNVVQMSFDVRVDRLIKKHRQFDAVASDPESAPPMNSGSEHAGIAWEFVGLDVERRQIPNGGEVFYHLATLVGVECVLVN